VLVAEAETTLGDLRLEVAFEVGPGDCLALAGPSGAGKTSVLRAVAGLLRPRRGYVRCGDEVWLDTTTGRSLPAEQRRCGYLFQDYALFPHLTARGNVAYALQDLPRPARERAAAELLGRFGVGRLADTKPATLSGGGRQRVALARALARRPDVLLLDEPLAALDAANRATATRELAAVLREHEVPAVLVTHDFEEAAQLGSRVAILEDGRIAQEGVPSEVASRPSSAFVAGFTGATVLNGIARQGPSGLTVVDLDGGGTVASTDAARDRVGASIHPWEIAIEPAGDPHPHGSALNRLPAQVTSLTAIGNRVRLGLDASQPLVAEITLASSEQLGLREGVPVVATWKAAATRLVSL
jgi:molybdate transport system ATP-binding protein